MLTQLTVIISQYIQISNHYVVPPKRTYCSKNQRIFVDFNLWAPSPPRRSVGGAGSSNFLVGSWVTSPILRPHPLSLISINSGELERGSLWITKGTPITWEIPRVLVLSARNWGQRTNVLLIIYATPSLCWAVQAPSWGCFPLKDFAQRGCYLQQWLHAFLFKSWNKSPFLPLDGLKWGQVSHLGWGMSGANELKARFMIW